MLAANAFLKLSLFAALVVHPSPSLPSALRTTPEGSAFEWMDGDTHASGNVIAGEIIEHTFVLFSSGDAPLVIEELATDCNCTTFQAFRIDGSGERSAYETGTPLPPGDTLELAVRIDTTDKVGQLAFNVRIKTDAPDQTWAAARSTLECRSAFQAEPSPLPLGELLPDQTATGTMRVTNVFGEPFAPELEAHPFAEWIAVELEPIDPDPSGLAQAWDVHIDVAPGLPPKGNDLYPLRLRTTLPGKQRFASSNSDGVATFTVSMHVALRARDWIEADPRKIDFGRLWARRTYKRTVTIANNDPEFELALAPADVSLSGYGGPFAWADYTTLELFELDNGNVEIAITVSGLPQRMTEPFQGYLSVRTGHDAVPKLEVPLSGQHR